MRFCEHHNFSKHETDIASPLQSKLPSEFIVDPWECEFIGEFDFQSRIELLQAANFLNIPALFGLCCAVIAAEFKGKNFNDVKNKFGLSEVSYTPASEEQLKKRHPWFITETNDKFKSRPAEHPWELFYSGSLRRLGVNELVFLIYLIRLKRFKPCSRAWALSRSRHLRRDLFRPGRRAPPHIWIPLPLAAPPPVWSLLAVIILLLSRPVSGPRMCSCSTRRAGDPKAYRPLQSA